MFGSDFFSNFGIPDPSFQGVDAQGGLFGPTTTPDQNAPPAAGLPPTPDKLAAGAPGGVLGGGVLAPGGSALQPGSGTLSAAPAAPPAQGQSSAPAAGIGSPFGRQNG